MNRAIETCQRNELWALIKQVSEFYGGDDIEELKASAKEMVKNYTIEQALACFRDLAAQCQSIVALRKPKNETHQTGIEPPREIQYQPPFVK